MRHANISIFVPHLGCPKMCSFCDQRTITGTNNIPHKCDIDEAVNTAILSDNYDSSITELAFFGGSFTAIKHDYMIELLEAGYNYVKEGKIKGIRISTRPDYIDNEILLTLKKYGVTSIELGAQSMCDDVLLGNNRGHSAKDVYDSCDLIKKYGFEIGLQMMVGLYKSNPGKDLFTADEICKIKPDTVRIYPTVTLKGTELERLYNAGKYIPYTLDETVDVCAGIIKRFNDCGIKIIRTGLHTIDEDKYVAGPWHPAFRELCDSKIFFDNIKSMLFARGTYCIKVSSQNVSKVIGNKKSNLKKLSESGYFCKVVGLKNVSDDYIIVERK